MCSNDTKWYPGPPSAPSHWSPLQMEEILFHKQLDSLSFLTDGVDVRLFAAQIAKHFFIVISMEIMVETEDRCYHLGCIRAHREQLKWKGRQFVRLQIDDVLAQFLQHHRLFVFRNVHFTVGRYELRLEMNEKWKSHFKFLRTLTETCWRCPANWSVAISWRELFERSIYGIRCPSLWRHSP